MTKTQVWKGIGIGIVLGLVISWLLFPLVARSQDKPKAPEAAPFVKCQLQNRPDTALDAKTNKMVPVGPDRWFVLCADVVTIKGKQREISPRYLHGDLGGYGYYAQYMDAAKAAYDATHPKPAE